MKDPLYVLFQLLVWVIQALQLIIVIDAILTWFPNVDRRNPIVASLRKVTAPIYAPIRKLIPPEKTGYVDFSPMIAIFALYVIGRILQAIA